MKGLPIQSNQYTESINQQEPSQGDPAPELSDISFCTDLATAESIQNLNSKIHNLVKKLGFTDFYLRVLHSNSSNYISTFPDIVCSRLTEKKDNTHLLIKHAKSATRPVFLSDIIEFATHSPIQTDLFLSAQHLSAALKNSGFNDCYSISRPTPKQEFNTLFILSDKNASSAELRIKVNKHKTLLHLLAEAVAVIGISSFEKYFLESLSSNALLRPNSIQLLNIIAKENLTLKEASEKLGISVHTANKYIAKAKAELNANTLASLVFKAMNKSIIKIEN